MPWVPAVRDVRALRGLPSATRNRPRRRWQLSNRPLEFALEDDIMNRRDETTAPQLGTAEILAMIRRMGGRATLSELSEAASLSLDDMENMIDDLEKRKLVEWQFDARRKVYSVRTR